MDTHVTMECNILKELAGFDPHAPINVSISFEDSDESDERPIKSEKTDTDDYNNQIVDYLPDTDLKLKEIVKEEPTSTYETIEEGKADTQNEQNFIQKDTTLRSGHLQNDTLNSNESRKRKNTQLNINKNNKRSSQSSICEPNNQSSPVNDSENMCENFQPGTSPISTSNQSNSTPAADLPSNLPSKKCNVNQVQTDKLSSYIKRCLLPISEHMRLIMEAYSYYREQNTPKAKDAFNILKRKFFNLSYSTVVAMLLPEEKNVEFINTFLKETHRHACETSSVHKGTLKDYETLLRELLHLTKYNKMIIDKAASKKDTMLKTSSGNENKNVQEPSKTLEQNPANSITESKNADQDKICIFSAGFQENEISINIDPTLQKYLHTMNTTTTLENNQPLNPRNVQEHSPSPRNTRAETELIKYLTKSPLKFRNSKQDALNQPTGQPIIPQTSNIPQSNYPSQNDFEFNHRYVNGNASKSDRLTQIQQLPLQQSFQVPSQQILQRYGLSSEVLQQCNQSTHSAPQYRPTHHVPQYGRTQHAPQYGPTHHAQSSQSQSQYWQSQLGYPQHKQLNQAQSTATWQPPNRMPQHGEQQRQPNNNPPSYEQISRQQQYVQQQNLLRQYLSSQNVSPPPSSQHGTSNHKQAQHSPLQHGQSQYRQLQRGQPQNVLPQFSQTQAVNVQPGNPSPTEWQQSNMLQYQTQAPTGVLAHTSSPRTVSTDSGFISPLNFVSSEQMVPPDPPQAPSEGDETANLLITHVTSLNPKVAFIQEAKCVVCKTLTKQVCMGCMQRYYCSYDCQVIDWTNHESSCKRY